jgi:hypothetical protein
MVGLRAGLFSAAGAAMKLSDVPDALLRAWVDAGAIKPGVYETEMRRRREAARDEAPSDERKSQAGHRESSS